MFLFFFSLHTIAFRWRNAKTFFIRKTLNDINLFAHRIVSHSIRFRCHSLAFCEPLTHTHTHTVATISISARSLIYSRSRHIIRWVAAITFPLFPFDWVKYAWSKWCRPLCDSQPNSNNLFRFFFHFSYFISASFILTFIKNKSNDNCKLLHTFLIFRRPE